jgi:hypothetical protein
LRSESERTPIFATLQSEWFRARAASPAGADAGSRPRAWASPGDDGWRRAAEVLAQPLPQLTVHGLPRRVPGRNLLPGAARMAPTPPAPRPAREGAHGLGRFQREVSRARRGQPRAADGDATDGR